MDNPFLAPTTGFLTWLTAITVTLGIITLIIIGIRWWRGRALWDDTVTWFMGGVFVFGAARFVAAFQAWGGG